MSPPNYTLNQIAALNLKIDDYWVELINLQSSAKLFSREMLKSRAAIKFDLSEIAILTAQIPDRSDVADAIIWKAVDLKLTTIYLLDSFGRFYIGPTVIVGNGEFEKLNRNTLSLLQGNHYRVYLISTAIEQALDLFQLLVLGQLYDHKKDKWGKIIERCNLEKSMLPNMSKQILKFRDEYRVSEYHKSSKVRSFLSKNEWNHFQDEEKMVENLLLILLKTIKDLAQHESPADS
jgi:hypothetical protein